MTWDLPGQRSPGEIKCEPRMEDNNFQQPHVKESKETDEINFNDAAAATAAKLLQSCPTLCNPIDGSPPGFPVPGILQARAMEWVAVSFSNA